MRVLVIGGNLFIGKHLVHTLAKAGHEVTILHRRPGHDLGKKVQEIIGDRNDMARLKPLLAGREFEAVFDNAYDWERGTTGAQVEATVKACGGKLHRYVFMSSVGAYGDGLNHHEGDGLAADDHHDPYVRNKACSERTLFRLHQRYGTPVVTLRPPYVYGPCNPFYREQFFWDRLRDKRPLILPGDGRRLMQFSFVKDLVWSCHRVLEVPAAVGHAFNIANARPLTQAEVVEAFMLAAGKKDAQIVRIPRERIHRLGGNPMGPHLYFGMYFDLPPITMVIAKAQRVLGFKPTPFAEGLKDSYKWYLKNHHRPALDYAFENKLLTMAQAC